jgi:tetratricopeptide (TPR) repeat protein
VADTLLFAAHDLARETFGPESRERVSSLFALAGQASLHRNPQGADSFYTEAFRHLAASGADADSAVDQWLAELASVQADLGAADSALVLVSRALELHRGAGDTTGMGYVGTLQTLALILRRAERLDSAERVYREILRRQQQLPEANRHDVARTHNNLGFLLRTRKDFAGAEASYRAAYEMLRPILGDAHPTVSIVVNNLAAALELLGKIEAAAALTLDRIRAAEREWPAGHWRIGAARAALGRLFLRHDRAAEAVPFLQGAVTSYEQTLGTEHGWTAVARTDLAVGLLLLGRTAAADAAFRQAEAALVRLGRNIDGEGQHSLGRAATMLEASGHDQRARRIRQILAGEQPGG